ncbi:MAG: NAD(P)-dependent alcohol dehydrogenase [Deltaproteobacteria bacterium]|nr:NAD(P)-dependent alcohol dehydrogenase [Deltaproteobacteria bacterium]
MKAWVFDKYGEADVLYLDDINKPEPKDNEILIRICSTTVAAADWRMRKAEPFVMRLMNGLTRPKKIRVLGFELAGEVESVGKDIKRFKKGDYVFAFSGLRFGTHSEYICLPEKGSTRSGLVEKMPEGSTFSSASAIPAGGLTSIYFLKEKGNISKGKRVLVYGASGSVGTFSVQIAKYYGAEVTAVCSSKNVELVKSLGADHIIDYTKENYSHSQKEYDIIFDAVGKTSKSEAKKVLAKGGLYLSSKQIATFSMENLGLLKQLYENSDIKTVVDREYSFEEIPEAHRYVEGFHKVGNVVVKVEQKTCQEPS